MTDIINHPPPHYKSNGMEAIDVIEAFELPYNLGNAAKYILRAGRKHDRIFEDLEKAIWYLRREAIKTRPASSLPDKSKRDYPEYTDRDIPPELLDGHWVTQHGYHP